MASYMKLITEREREHYRARALKAAPASVIFDPRERMRCLVCGSALQATVETFQSPDGDSTRYRRYECESAHACTALWKSDHDVNPLRIEGA